MQTVGELHQEDADVFRHGEHELAEVLCLLGLSALELDLGELGDAVHQPRDFLSEQLAHVFERRMRILNDVM